MHFFSNKLKMGAYERCIDGKLVGKGVPNGLKKGGHDDSTSSYHLPMVVPPPPGLLILPISSGQIGS